MGVLKHFNYGKTLANEQKPFDFDTPNIKSILRYFDGFNHNYRTMYEFPRLKYCVKFFLYNKRILSVDVKKDPAPSKLTGVYKTT